MKIVIVGFTKIKYMPYLNFYLNQIQLDQNQVHLIYWNRDQHSDLEIDNRVKSHVFNENMLDSVSLLKKIPKLFKFRYFAKKVINKLNPDLIIVLHSTTAFTIADLLCFKYKNRYIFDYRDFTYENLSFYKTVISKIVRNARLCFTSSDGFRKVLPITTNIFTSHNIMSNADSLRKNYENRKQRKNDTIKIGFWGLLRHYEINKEIISKIGVDERFEIHYFGRAQGRMLELMNESTERYNNVFYHGEYRPEERYKFAYEIDLVHNMYDNFGTILYAMGNKYYDSIVFNLPQICTKNTYMAEYVEKNRLGLACDPYDHNLTDEIYNYYNDLDYGKFTNACDDELKRVLKQVNVGNNKIKEVIADGCK